MLTITLDSTYMASMQGVWTNMHVKALQRDFVSSRFSISETCKPIVLQVVYVRSPSTIGLKCATNDVTHKALLDTLHAVQCEQTN